MESWTGHQVNMQSATNTRVPSFQFLNFKFHKLNLWWLNQSLPKNRKISNNSQTLNSSLNPISYLSNVNNCFCSTLPQILSIRLSCNYALKGGNMASKKLTKPFSWSNSTISNNVFSIPYLNIFKLILTSRLLPILADCLQFSPEWDFSHSVYCRSPTIKRSARLKEGSFTNERKHPTADRKNKAWCL